MLNPKPNQTIISNVDLANARNINMCLKKKKNNT